MNLKIRSYLTPLAILILTGTLIVNSYIFEKPKQIKTNFASISGDCGGPNGTLDGFVDLFDYGSLSRSFGLIQGQPGFNLACDFYVDSHNIIDLFDYQILANNFGKTVTLNTPTPSSHSTAWYIDNQAAGTNTGSSWANAWKNFASINWSSVKPGDTLYISGGSTSKIYKETLIVEASGSANGFITIDVGANSPSPSGHDGVVVLDGGGTERDNVYSYGNSYIRINGYDMNGNYKLKLQNSRFAAEGDAAILIRNGDYLIVDYVKIDMGTNRGVFMYNTNHSRIRGTDIRTGSVNNTIQTDNIYVGYSYDTDIENNVLYNNNAVTTESHNDPIQCGHCGRVNIRNNFASTTYDADSLIVGQSTDWVHIYNNVFVSDTRQIWGFTVMLKGDENATGVMSLWNNTVVQTNNDQGHVLELYKVPEQYIGTIKNNILFGSYVDAITSDFPSATYMGKIDNNCLYRTSGSVISNIGGVERTWAQHQSAGYDLHGVNSNPLFVNNFSDLHLQNTSPCRDAGADLNAYFTTDKDGVTRPVGNSWDIGAYEAGR